MRTSALVSSPVIFLALCALGGCASPTPTPTPALTPTAAATATHTQTPTPTFTVSPTLTPTQTPSYTPSPTPTATPTDTAMPLGKALLYMSLETGQQQLRLMDLDQNTRLTIREDASEMGSLNWSPDGGSIVYQLDHDRASQIHRMDWNGMNDRNLSQGDRELYPVLSPDGAKIAFYASYPGHWAVFVMGADGDNPHPVTGNTVSESIISWSPDSTSMAFSPMHNIESPSFVARAEVNGTDFTELTHSDSTDTGPVWSPEGSRIAFTCVIDHMPQICTMKPDGTDRRTLTTAPGGSQDAAWSPDGKQIAFVTWRDSAAPNTCQDGDCNFEIYVMNTDGSHQQRLTNLPAEDWGPAWSPDGSQIAFLSLRDEPARPQDCGDRCNSEIYVMNADGSGVTRLTNNTAPDWYPLWRPDTNETAGHTPTPAMPTATPPAPIGGGTNQLLYWAQDNQGAVNLYLIDLDGKAKAGRVIGQGSSPDWSPDGKRVVFEADTESGGHNLFLMDADGAHRTQLTYNEKGAWEPAWSPDGGQIAYSADDAEIHLIGADGTHDQRIIYGDQSYYAPTWSPDGRQLAFLAGGDGLQADLYIAGRDGTGRNLVVSGVDWAAPPDWSPDGQWLAYGCQVDGGQVCLIHPDGTGEKVLTNQGTNGGPRWSPDGKWLAFGSHRDSNWEVYVMRADGSEQRRITSDWLANFGPVWRP